LQITTRKVVCSGRVEGCVVQEGSRIITLSGASLHDTGRNKHLDSAVYTYKSASLSRFEKY
jgi:hypothetical protein